MVLFSTSISFSQDDAKNADNGDRDKPAAQHDRLFNITGLYKNLFTFQETDDYIPGKNPFDRENKKLASDLNRIRLSPELNYKEKIIIHVDYDNELVFSNFNKSYAFDAQYRPTEYNSLIDMTWEPYYVRNVYYRTKIHRAYAKLSLENITLTAGRQQIRYGSGRLWNPLDILNPVSPSAVEGAEEQAGTDAVKLDWFFSRETELSLVYDQKRHDNGFADTGPKDANSVARFKTVAGENEIALLAGFISRKAAAGIDASTILYKGMLRGSAIYFHPDEGSAYFVANAGYEYTFKNGLYFLAEYFYNENSLNRNSALKNAYEQGLYAGMNQKNYVLLANQFLTYNEHYAGLALGYGLHPLVRADLFFIYDFQGRGIFISPSLKYNVFENIDLVAGAMLAYVFSGSDRMSDFEPMKKYGLYYLSLAAYF